MIQITSVNPINHSTSPSIQNISFGSDCSGGEKILNLTVKEWIVIETKISNSMKPILEMSKISASKPLDFPQLTNTELMGLREWMNTLTLPEKMGPFIMKFQNISVVTPLDKKMLRSCYKQTISSINSLTNTVFFSLTKYLNFLNNKKDSNGRKGEKEQSCIGIKVHRATIEEWEAIRKDAGLFARFVMEAKGERLDSFCNGCESVELPLFTREQQEGLKEWVRLLTLPGELKKLVSKEHSLCYLKGIEKINLILNLIMESIKWKLEFLADRSVDFKIYIDKIFPIGKAAMEIPKSQDFNFGVNLCGSTKAKLEICLSQKNTWEGFFRSANQNGARCERLLKACRVDLQKKREMDTSNKAEEFSKSEELVQALKKKDRCENDLKLCWFNFRSDQTGKESDLKKEIESLRAIKAGIGMTDPRLKTCEEDVSHCESRRIQAESEVWKCNTYLNISTLTEKMLELNLDRAKAELGRYTTIVENCLLVFKQTDQKLNKAETDLVDATKRGSSCESEKNVCLSSLEEANKVRKKYSDSIFYLTARLAEVCPKT